MTVIEMGNNLVDARIKRGRVGSMYSYKRQREATLSLSHSFMNSSTNIFDSLLSGTAWYWGRQEDELEMVCATHISMT